ncbi:MFS transporter [Amycolatopsis rhabdoformis]|uniref:MFS transporter n=1 Tax=Amycolatopsis rhabdoformis TaxID=1448059 RepID=A0ABZ1HVB4_9PSEU|nr:MFS transporter [Amycolatopsis rhabdoformis]WSE26247.1 MFS transporter [Amycolatopsis rhabdoformis]
MRQAARFGSRQVGFAGICLGYFAIILDGSVLNIAVPALRRDLHTSLASVQWVINAYTLCLAALLLTAGALGDRWGLRRCFLWGTAIFTVASLACSLAPSVPVLILARVVQGVGAAALLPATLALIRTLFTDAGERGRATAIWVSTGAIATAVGPMVGGLLIDAFGWRAIFLINLPIGVVAILLGRAGITEAPRHARGVDHAGQLTAVAALGLITAGVIVSGGAGWTAPLSLGLLAAGVVSAAAFWLVERRVAEPMLPPAFFSVRVRSVAVASAAFMGFLFYGTLFVMSLYFQQVRGWSAGEAGVALLPLTVGSTIGSLVLYRPLARRFGDAVALVSGFACCASGVVVLLVFTRAAGYTPIAVGLLLVGVSSTIAFSALTSLLVPSVPVNQSGIASGVQNTSRQTGALMSVAVLGAILNTAVFTARLPVALGVLAGVVVLALVAAGFATRPAR